MTDKNAQPIEPAKRPVPQKPMNTWKQMVAHLCIWFLVVVLIMVYFTSTGSPQAGLLEVGVSAMIFVVLFHLVMKFFPLVSKIITSVLVIGFGIALIYVNYHFLKVVKNDASFKQLLVGDLLVHKIMKTVRKEPIVVVVKEEIPAAVSKPEYEKTVPPMSLDQLKTTLAGPVTADMESPRFSVIAPAIQAEVAGMGKKYDTDMSVSDKGVGISGLKFITAGCETMIRDVPDRGNFTFLPFSPVVREPSISALQESDIQSTLSDTTTPILIRELNGPFKEGRIPID